MNRPALRLAHPGQLPAAATGDDSLQVLTDAIHGLARPRPAAWLWHSALPLRSRARRSAQAEQLLPKAVHDVPDQDLTWPQIGEHLGTTAATAARRYRNKP